MPGGLPSRDPPHTSVWEWSLAASPERLWPYVSDTDRLNRLAGDIVIAEEVREDLAVFRFLARAPHREESFIASLKGIAREAPLRQLWPAASRG